MAFSLFNMLATAIIALVAGAALGALLVQQMTPQGRKQRELEQNLDKMMQQQRSYQTEVVAHFNQTAKLLANLTSSYREIHNHLASGASSFNAEEGSEILSQLASPRASTEPGAAPLTDIRQPLDYAPKTSPHEPGMLNEAFGLEKAKAAPEKIVEPARLA